MMKLCMYHKIKENINIVKNMIKTSNSVHLNSTFLIFFFGKIMENHTYRKGKKRSKLENRPVSNELMKPNYEVFFFL